MCYDCTVKCHNLPSQLSTFIGREREIATVIRLLNGTRLLTLVGPGGCGKTRLAMAVAERLTRRYPEGVWFVDLASVSDPDLVPHAVAAALDFRTLPGRAVLEALTAQLRTQRVLFLLDNCEHLLRACTALAYTILTACPNVRILATSRESLHVTGETTWTVPPLAMPDLKALPALGELGRIEAVRLFVERAGHFSPGFTLNEQNALAVSQICSWLAGSPLAIELAAARVRVLSPEQIAARVWDALSLLATGDRTVPARHRTLQATLDWSYSLLSAREQSLFRRLSVFAGSFSVEGAEAIGAAGECYEERALPLEPSGSTWEQAPVSVLDLLAGLVDKSLLEVEAETRAERRYRYLEPVRQYALTKLEASGDAQNARDRLLAWAAALAEEVGPGTYQSSARTSVERLEVEHPNLRAALEWGMTRPTRAVERHRLAIELGQFWQQRGYIREGMAWFEQLIDRLDEVPVHVRIDTLTKAAFLAIHAQDFGRTRHCLEQALALAEGLDDRYRMPVIYDHLCWLAMNEGDLEEADRLCDVTLPILEQSGDNWGRAVILFYRANIEYLRRSYSRARESAEESVAICRENGYAPALARRLIRLGQIYQAEGDHEGARLGIADGLRISRETGDNWGIAMALAAMAGLARDEGQLERAAWLLGVTQYYLDRFGVPMWRVDQLEYDRCAAELRALLGEEIFQAARERGIQQGTRDLDGSVESALRGLEPGDARRIERRKPGPSLGARPKADVSPLTRREEEVAALIAQGRSNAEIAAALFIGLRTVEAHVTHILNKLGFSSRAQIAAWLASETKLSSLVAPEARHRAP